MINCEVEVSENDILLIRVDLKKVCGYTSGRKNVRISSSLGNLQLPGRDGKLRVERFNLNVWRALTPQEEAAGGIRLEGWGKDET